MKRTQGAKRRETKTENVTKSPGSTAVKAFKIEEKERKKEKKFDRLKKEKRREKSSLHDFQPI